MDRKDQYAHNSDRYSQIICIINVYSRKNNDYDKNAFHRISHVNKDNSSAGGIGGAL